MPIHTTVSRLRCSSDPLALHAVTGKETWRRARDIAQSMSAFGSRSWVKLGSTDEKCIKQHRLLLYQLHLFIPVKQLWNLLHGKLDNEYATRQQKGQEQFACLKVYLFMINTLFSLINDTASHHN